MGLSTELIPNPLSAVTLSLIMLSENHSTESSYPSGIEYLPLAYPAKNVPAVIWQSPTLLNI
jgi:hypothetical protein